MAYTRDTSAQDRLSGTEQQIVAAVEAHKNAAIDFLERIVNMNSGSMNFDGVRRVGDAFDAELANMGFSTEWIDGESFGRAGHLFATRGTKGPHFLLVGHLDTVFELDSPFQSFERIDENKAVGPGIIDMKGGDVVMLEAIRALNVAGVLDHMTITVALIGDEESSGSPLELGRAALVDAAIQADIALAFEPGDGNPETAVLARRGFTGWELEVQGMRAHSSAVFSEKVGYGSIYEAARILTGFQETLVGEELLTFNPGIILGGTAVEYDEENDRGSAFGKTNVVSEKTIVAGDLRTISPEQRSAAKERMEAVVRKHLPETDATLSFRDSYPPMGMTEGNVEVLSILSQASVDAGYGPVTAGDPADAGAADVSFTAAHVQMAMDGLGMTGGGTHTTDEFADLSTLPMQTIRVALLMQRISASWSQ
ncbi:MAG: M20/M25/M40 family metallo-hydrolase [Bacteroidetes Order II. Incertae sedis bacterium]|nr:M20/M25/M40 family metallo-hydrolase [Bacteroidetes Order II. bacterium]MBT4602212.1 M20/M25/M40 family metallo-hydrolase [Bacteroidetes Order II. bacterium]MBT5249501.1 M20/M25/M40 family metallo-hydrolase [Bacteroidetes Order II. bacterium]MBT6201542.1 M20/M25/M40 family metallo-hydrolase [Bacteroidetes Order II. bacterium]MBT6424532.1 M20/M25/M40 family metallo-hydrolase [Bacteroidetes Order II. bacterium]